MSVPKLRFPGFTDDWDQHKLGEVGTTYTGLSGKTSADFGHGDARFVTYMNVYSNAVADPTMVEPVEIDKKQKEVEVGDVFFTTSSETPDEVGMSSVLLEKQGPTYLNSFCFGYRPTVKFDPFYLAYMLRSESVRKDIVFLAQGISRYNISKNKMMDIAIPVPSFEEQSAIGVFFKNLENLITLHQRKLENVQKLKKSMLQKMFPKNGEAVPEVRFPGFTDDWEQRKFSDFTFAAGLKNKENLELEPFAITNDKGFVPQSEAHEEFGYMSDVDRTMYIIVKPNSFAYNPARINVGSLGYYKGLENVIVSSLYEVFQTSDDVDDNFLNHWFKTCEFQNWIERLQEGSVRLYFYYDKLCECRMMMPSIHEQKKIGTFLDQIDDIITLHQRKLEMLKALKKGLLQQMFCN